MILCAGSGYRQSVVMPAKFTTWVATGFTPFKTVIETIQAHVKVPFT